MRILVALGGNAILGPGESRSASEQLANVKRACAPIVGMIRDGHEVAITHGNGPQVGDILLRGEAARATVPPMPLDVCGAESQGMIGYMIQQSMVSELAAAGLEVPVATVLTQTVVDGRDPAFLSPTKPIGPHYSVKEAEALRRGRGWTLAPEDGKGYRRLVPSPLPLEVVEGKMIRRLSRLGVVIAAGGGGVPVARSPSGELRGVEGVIDKDYAAAVLGALIGVRVLLILTDVENVMLNYGKEDDEEPLEKMTVADCERYLREGQFSPGSMKPKIEAAVRFVRSGRGRRAVIASLGRGRAALEGTAGTTITK